MGFWADTGPLGCTLALLSHLSTGEVLLAVQGPPSQGPGSVGRQGCTHLPTCCSVSSSGILPGAHLGLMDLASLCHLHD